MKKNNPLIGWFCLLVGIYPLAIALGFLPVDDSAVHAPMWVIALCGIVFLIAGCMILLQQHERIVDLLAAAICLSFSAVGVWVSLFSSSEGFSGGIPFIPEHTNITIARFVFGGGAVMTLLMCIYAIRRAFRPAD